MQQDRATEIVARIYRRLSDGREGNEYELASKTLRTWRRYDSGEASCAAIAAAKGLDLYPVDPKTGEPTRVKPEVLMAVFNAIVEHGGAVGSITIAKQALSLAYRLRGHPPPDWGRLREFFQEVKRKRGGPRRRAHPLRAADLEAITGRLDPTNERDARNGFLPAMGWGPPCAAMSAACTSARARYHERRVLGGNDHGLAVPILCGLDYVEVHLDTSGRRCDEPLAVGAWRIPSQSDERRTVQAGQAARARALRLDQGRRPHPPTPQR
jgi:hypothetical protein